MQLTEDTPAILTLFFRTHTVIAFRSFLSALLERRDVLEEYGLRRGFPYWLVWKVMTVDTCSGRHALLAQACLLPRVVACSDCRGNYTSSGRFIVFLSRFRSYLTLYIFDECLQSDTLPDTWKI